MLINRYFKILFNCRLILLASVFNCLLTGGQLGITRRNDRAEDVIKSPSCLVCIYRRCYFQLLLAILPLYLSVNVELMGCFDLNVVVRVCT